MQDPCYYSNERSTKKKNSLVFLVDDDEDTKEAVVQSYANSYFEKKTL